MAYTITSDTVGLAIDPASETATDVLKALNKARQMCETGLVNVSIRDEAGHQIEGYELLDCLKRKKEDHRRLASSLSPESERSRRLT
jgi:hypothetical protein